MAYDLDLANRIRAYVATEDGLSERKMFGGLAFLINGNMSVSASSRGGLLLRVDPKQAAKLTTRAHAHPFEMRGREMNGWLRIDPDGVKSQRDLARWVALSVAYAKALPPKRGL